MRGLLRAIVQRAWRYSNPFANKLSETRIAVATASVLGGDSMAFFE